MTIRNPNLVLLQILLLPLLTAHVSTSNHSCGSNTLQYHFGFSSGCNISLSCNNSNIFISEFPVLFIVTENIMITVEATCNHPFQNLHQLYNPNYAPTFRNTILLENCSTPISPCILPPLLTAQCFPNSSTNSTSYKNFIKWNEYRVHDSEHYGQETNTKSSRAKANRL